ncbi:uncharacterized protein BX664DRAFT_331619 [Halteromyces radiatus]|uniref:uncharacterized protein n=1 Tax=Halteromyces radiatus TaxID=101107 RepID=UPI002220A6D5|nr:uncharacterized protein BX664DRAFT_331619 [Halteromyces radiatus]KAI8088869.1 hypothetical protein BX664DRAFT_331619 [Halteromyces radiatus]
MNTPSKQAAISAYRHLLKTQKEVFGKDLRAIQAAKRETYARFMQYKDETNTDILDEKLTLAKQVATLLRQNVVQGESKDGQHFKLNITKDTELGDNDSIKNSKNIHRKGKKRATTTSCCGGH